MAKKLPAIMTVERRRKAAAKKFAEKWLSVEGRENEDCQRFWMELLQSVYGVANPADVIRFEFPVDVESKGKGKIDAYLPGTRVVIEQKSSGIDLTAVNRKAGELELTPYQQAKRYAGGLPYSKAARWIVTCNFREFRIHDLDSDKPSEPVCIVQLAELPGQFHVLDFLVDAQQVRVAREKEVSVEAGRHISRIYHALLSKCPAPDDTRLLHDLNKFCVRLVFCLYAEDAGLFAHGQFWQYVSKGVTPEEKRQRMLSLFKTLNKPMSKRDPFNEALKAFPYVNGGLFDDDELFIPMLDEGLCKLLEESSGFNWKDISPTIFGGLFESTLNPETRRSGGMHYTSIENIHKVIDPLFLNDLRTEFTTIKQSDKGAMTRKRQLMELQDKLAGLVFLDPACGSGNFLTESYLSLRRLENDILREMTSLEKDKNQLQMLLTKVDIHQFFGIEINDFAVSVAKTALWIADAQMWEETQEILHNPTAFLPLKQYEGIREANALRVDWLEHVPGRHVDYIIGNPPFVGYTYLTAEQKDGVASVWKTGNYGFLDFVSAWYKKAADLMLGTPVRAAFVSTNSICQGQQVAIMWGHLLGEMGMHIDFAYRTFKWANEARDSAAVHCVIVGFSHAAADERKMLVDENGAVQRVPHINGYLTAADDVFIDNRSKPLCKVPPMINASKPTGNFFFSAEEYREICKTEPRALPFLRRTMGGKEFIRGIERWCLWLVDAPLNEARKIPLIAKRLQEIRDERLKSPKAYTRQSAETPYLFQQLRQPETDYIVVPQVSSENREYIPLGFLSPDVVCTDKIRYVPDATLYHFGVLTSAMHMAWMRAVAGRLKSDYSYSNKVVYNNFPWPEPTNAQKEQIAALAQDVLDARAMRPNYSLADLYDPLTMPAELRKAHKALDAAVDKAYGRKFKDDAARVAHLFELYKKLAK